jgi:hypothetical protein
MQDWWWGHYVDFSCAGACGEDEKKCSFLVEEDHVVGYRTPFNRVVFYPEMMSFNMMCPNVCQVLRKEGGTYSTMMLCPNLEFHQRTFSQHFPARLSSPPRKAGKNHDTSVRSSRITHQESCKASSAYFFVASLVEYRSPALTIVQRLIYTSHACEATLFNSAIKRSTAQTIVGPRSRCRSGFTWHVIGQ